jgi:hypothetical protein
MYDFRCEYTPASNAKVKNGAANLHSPTYQHGMVFNELSTGTILPFYWYHTIQRRTCWKVENIIPEEGTSLFKLLLQYYYKNNKKF